MMSRDSRSPFALHTRTLKLVCCGLIVLASACGPEDENNTSTPPADMSSTTDDMKPSADMSSDMDSSQGDMSADMMGQQQDMPSGYCGDSPLTTSVEVGFAIPFGSVLIEVSGGTGNYTFSLAENNSEAILNESTGEYLAGRLANTTDKILIQDTGCDQSIVFDINVVEPMHVSPAEIEVLPGTSFNYQVTSGSGEYSYAVDQNETGGTIDALGNYTAGLNPGRDTIFITDSRSGQIVEALVYVSPTATFKPKSDLLVLPLGESYLIETTGGSSEFNVDIMGDSVSYDAVQGTISADSVGTSTLILSDKILSDEQTTLKVHVAESQTFPEVNAGEYFNKTTVIAHEDLDNDGIEDLIFAHPESDLAGWRSGSVFIYKGTSSGFETPAVQVFTGDKPDDFYGYDVELADLDQDGNKELIVGARLGDVGASSTGSVYVYRGLGNGFFDQTPQQIWSGANSGDEFGWDVEACDFNGDGLIDIAVGAPNSEDRTQQPTAGNQGGVHLFLNYPTGFLNSPDLSLWGYTLDANNSWTGKSNLLMGRYMTSNDFDGDGLCDLAVGVHTYDSDAQNDTGAVYIYKGKAPDNIGPGGISTRPNKAIVNDVEGARNANFGWRLDSGDLNGDDKAELLVSAYVFFDTTTNWSSGAAFVFEHDEALPDDPATTYDSVTEAIWTTYGVSNYSRYGWDVHMGLTQDGNAKSIYVSDYNAPLSNVGRPGAVYAYDDIFNQPEQARVYYGQNSGDFFGQGISTTQDRDGDGLRDLVTFSSRTNTADQVDVGNLFLVNSGAELADMKDYIDPFSYTDIPFEDVASGSYVGYSGNFVNDLNGDGKPELAVGALFYELDTSTSINRGAVLLYPSTEEGYAKEPEQILINFPTNSTSDQFGYRVEGAGDFNNDGINDLAVIADREDRSRLYDSNAWTDNTCPDQGGTRNDTGAVYIFLGTSDGLVESTPGVLIHGPEAGQRITSFAAGIDVNNDGYDDVVYGSNSWDLGKTNQGGVAVLLGRDTSSRSGTEILPICEPNLLLPGGRNDDQLGISMTSMGDLNGDGCADFASGARTSDLAVSNQGHVRVYLSTKNADNNRCNINAMKFVALAPGLGNSFAGWDVAGGHDVTGDGVSDLAVSTINYNVNNETVGGVWLVDGSYILSLQSLALSQHESLTAEDLNPFIPATQTSPYLVTGAVAGDSFGYSVKLVPGAGHATDTAGVLIGAHTADIAGAADSGGAYLWKFKPASDMSPASFESRPYMIFSGETEHENSLIGAAVSGTQVGTDVYLMINGHRSWFTGREQGASFVFKLD